jgi:hypothetical protein
MTLVGPTRLTPATTRVAVRVQDLTGLKEDVLYAVGYAERVGALVRVEPVTDHGNGSVTVRVHHTLLVPLVLPTQLAAVRIGHYRDWMDYVEIGLRLAPWLLGAGLLWVGYTVVTRVMDWFDVHSTVIASVSSGVLGLAALLGLLCLLGGGRGGGCVGLHCGGCKG